MYCCWCSFADTGGFSPSAGSWSARSVFWSPFVAVSLLPMVAVLLKENGIRPFLRWQNLLLSLPLVVLIGSLPSGYPPALERYGGTGYWRTLPLNT